MQNDQVRDAAYNLIKESDKSSGYIVGMIIVGGRPFAIRTHYSNLVLDVKSWTLETAAYFEDESYESMTAASEAEHMGRDLMRQSHVSLSNITYAQRLKEIADENFEESKLLRECADVSLEKATSLRAWVQTQQGFTLAFPDLGSRQSLGFACVRSHSMLRYVRAILDRSLIKPLEDSDVLPECEFLLVADDESPKLYVLDEQSLAPLARHTGPDVLGMRVDSLTLARQLMSSMHLCHDYMEQQAEAEIKAALDMAIELAVA